MSENKKSPPPKKSITPDWLVGGVLAKIGESFDKLTGRNWKPSSSLATSELIERLKKLLDSKVRDLGDGGRFVPHNVKLKMQWDKFSTDAEAAMQKLQNELLAAMIDHINDNRYHTYAPIKVEVKPDYFTEGVNLHASFEKFGEEEESDEVLKVTMPNVNLQNIVISPDPEPEPEPEKFVATFRAGGKDKTIELEFKQNQRLNVGRTKENNLSIDDPSVSKIHASLVLNAENQLMVADTGSTNGTFINGQRIAYGKALMISDGTPVKFGTVDVFFRRVPKPVDFATRESYETGGETKNLQPEMPPALNTSPAVIQPEAIKQNPPSLVPTAIYKTNQDAEVYKTNENYVASSDGAAENRQIAHNDSQVFQTEQRIKLDFGVNDNGSADGDKK
jgi:pSer/pThr/pTyr-binding forkhead associated (FHA) protein